MYEWLKDIYIKDLSISKENLMRIFAQLDKKEQEWKNKVKEMYEEEKRVC